MIRGRRGYRRVCSGGGGGGIGVTVVGETEEKKRWLAMMDGEISQDCEISQGCGISWTRWTFIRDGIV